MEDLMDTSELISDADILPSVPSAAKPAGKGAPELLSNMSGLTVCSICTSAWQPTAMLLLIYCRSSRALWNMTSLL